MFDFKFDWNSSFETGIRIIDLHHQELFKICREIEQLLLAHCIGYDDSYLISLLCKLRDYITYHFYEEELFMKSINHPQLAQHTQSHKVFTDQINAINVNHLCAQPYEAFTNIKDLIQEWVFEHLLFEDAAISSALTA